MLTKEQVDQIKEQLLKQLATLPEDQKEEYEEQIMAMNQEQLEAFLITNNMIRDKPDSDQGECVFCSIISGKIPTYKIAENKYSIATLEINPISKGHILIIPRIHNKSDKIPTQAFSLAKKLSEKIKKLLKPKKVDLITSEVFEHGIINVLPIYENEHLGMPRKKATEEELLELQKLLEIKTKPKRPKKEKVVKHEEPKKLMKAPRRIP